MFVSTRTPTLLALLLLMATLQPYHLLPTEQSSLVPSLGHQMKASNFVTEGLRSKTESYLTSPLPSTPVKGHTLSPVLAACMMVIEEKGELSHCQNKASVKYPNPTGSNVENSCKSAYYIVDCVLMAACKYCTDTKAVEIDEARKELESKREECKEWSSDEPKLDCSSSSNITNRTLTTGLFDDSTVKHSKLSTLRIICIIAVVLLLLMVILRAIYWLYFIPNKSGPSSMAGGGGSGSRGSSSKLNSGKAGSTVGSKQQQSRVTSGAKQSSRASTPNFRQPGSSVEAKQLSRA